MTYPQLKIDLNKLKHNTKVILDICKSKGISVAGVTKGFCAIPEIVEAMVEAGIETIADSRIENLKKIQHIPVKKLLLRLPMPSQAEDVVNFADISLNSEVETIDALSHAAQKFDKQHKVILMVDLGDLREGILPHEVTDVVEEILNMSNIELAGIGVNLNCYGGVIPTGHNLSELVSIAHKIEKEYSISIPIISGGNSGSIHLIQANTMPKEINHLRIGEAILRGFETSFGKHIPNTFTDVFTFTAEVIEIREKSSVPIGTLGLDSFGNKPVFVDKGQIWRAIIACGKQDIKVDGLLKKDPNISILGGSSDHTILDVTKTSADIRVGDIIEFELDYGAILMACTSEYVNKTIFK